jgi:Cu+-exporting ATPase
MSVDPATATEHVEYSGSTYYFCSAGCKETFDTDPGKYIDRSKIGPAAQHDH